MTLDEVKRGMAVRIGAVGDADTRAELVRLGIAEGTHVTCIAHLWGGTIVLARGSQEIAVGGSVARRIRVTVW